MRYAAVAGAVGVLLISCATAHHGALGPSGYQQQVYGFTVGYKEPDQKTFLDSAWTLDNYFPGARGALKPKKGPDYEGTREFDANGDGQIGLGEKSSEDIYDLRFVNGRDDGVIWLKAHPLTPKDARRDLDVVLSNYADGLSGAGLYAQSNLFSVEHAKVRQFMTFVTNKQEMKLGPNLAIAGTIELAEAEKAKLDPSFRTSKVRIVFAEFAFYERAHFQGDPSPWPVVERDGKSWSRRPALLVAGYYNTVSRFDEHLGEFDDVLRRIAFAPDSVLPDVRLGMAPADAPSPAPSAAPTPPP